MTLAKGDHLAKIMPANAEVTPVTGEAQHRFEVVECATTPTVYIGPTDPVDYNKPENWQAGHVLVVLKVVE